MRIVNHLQVFMNQLQTANPQWDLAFPGDCCRLSEDAPFHERSRESYSPNVPFVSEGVEKAWGM